MGQRTSTATLFGIVAAFVERRTWSQADLARRLETRTETVKKRLEELQAGGFALERSEDHPHVYWSVPKNWFPGALIFKPDEVSDLLRVLARAPKSALRDGVHAAVIDRLSNLGQKKPDLALPLAAPGFGADEETRLAVIEDAARDRVVLRMRYFTASRRQESWRLASVHRIDVGERTTFVATCHRSSALRRFRLQSVLDAKLDANEPFRATTPADLARFDEETLGGFHQEGPRVHCAFVVRADEAAWVEKNLPDARILATPTADGTRFTVDVPKGALVVLARFVVGLGAAARAETPELASEITAIAEGALASGAKKRQRRATR